MLTTQLLPKQVQKHGEVDGPRGLFEHGVQLIVLDIGLACHRCGGVTGQGLLLCLLSHQQVTPAQGQAGRWEGWGGSGKEALGPGMWGSGCVWLAVSTSPQTLSPRTKG